MKLDSLKSYKSNFKLEGGLRPKDLFHKKSEPTKPLVSIITVVRNGEKYLEQTIKSVLNQTYDNIEYIIVDGVSSDKTLDIINRYDNQIAYWMSEPDRGHFDAMNKGSQLATGDYALYLNADDYLYSQDAIEKALNSAINGNSKRPLLIVGKVKFGLVDKLLDWVWPIDESKMYKYGPAHQAALINKTIFKNIPYNIFFKVSGDTEYWARLRAEGLFQPQYTEVIISVFRLGGVSNNLKMEYYKYLEHEIFRYFSFRKFSMLKLFKGRLLACFKRTFRTILGEKLYYQFLLYGVYQVRKRFL